MRLRRSARSFVQLVLLRGAEGLGESFYFPASMSVLADYHGPRTRSRAMSIHQTSVYLGTAGGWFWGATLGPVYGWRSPFWVLGLAGMAYAADAGVLPGRAAARAGDGQPDVTEPTSDDERNRFRQTVLVPARQDRANPDESRTPSLLLAVFVGANFVAGTFLSWLPMFVYRETFTSIWSDSGLTRRCGHSPVCRCTSWAA